MEKPRFQGKESLLTEEVMIEFLTRVNLLSEEVDMNEMDDVESPSLYDANDFLNLLMEIMDGTPSKGEIEAAAQEILEILCLRDPAEKTHRSARASNVTYVAPPPQETGKKYVSDDPKAQTFKC